MAAAFVRSAPLEASAHSHRGGLVRGGPAEPGWRVANGEAARGSDAPKSAPSQGLLDTLFTCHALASGRHRDRATGTQLALTWASVALLCVLLAERGACALAVGPSRFLASPLHALDALLLAAVLVSEAVLAGAYEGESEAVGLAVVLHLLRVGHDLGDREEADARILVLEARLRELEEGGKGAG